jgi:hypothetical protein
MIDDAKLKKLPVWAQQEIMRLTCDASEWRNKALAATGGSQQKTDSYVADGLEEVGLPPHTNVRYYIGKRGRTNDRQNAIDVRPAGPHGHHPDDVLIVIGGGPISVMPAASNLVYIKPGWSK